MPGHYALINIPISFRRYAVYEVGTTAIVIALLTKRMILSKPRSNLIALEMHEREVFKISPESDYRTFKNITALRGDQNELKLYVPAEEQMWAKYLLK